jgi:hypothetical protein
MRRAAKIDSNQTIIVEALRKAGATVQSLAAIGDGCPDLLVGYANKTALIEVKDGAKAISAQKLRPLQSDWHGKWKGGTLATVNSVESALGILRIMTN